MEKQITGKGIAKDMEYLVRLLHKEWERSGRTKAEVTVKLNAALEIEKRMAAVITEKQKLLDAEEMNFKQSMILSKENFVLLRLVKKIKKAEDKAKKKGMEVIFAVELDQEEYRIFQEIIGTQEG